MLMRLKRSSKTASANPPVACASSEYKETRLKPLDVTTFGVPTTTQLRTTHGATTTIDTTPKQAAARQPARHTSHAAMTNTRSSALGRVRTRKAHAAPPQD